LEQAAGYTTVFLLTFVITGAAGAAAWALLEGSQRAARNRPAGAGAVPSSSILRSEMLSTISLFAPVLERFRFAEHLRELLDKADLDWSVGRLVLAMLTAGAAALNLLLWLQAPLWVALLCGVAVAALPILVLRRRQAQRLRRVEDQLPEALDYLSRALLAGHSLPMSVELLADECDPPLSLELRKTVDEYNLGLSMDDALGNLMERLPSVDIQFFVSAIQTQSRTGGSLHELLEDLSETIRERMTLKRQVRALTANGRMTAMVLSALPFVVGGTMLYINPDYFDLLLTHRLGPTLLVMALCGQVLAYLVIRRIVNIRV
jgi:tight adherence protein B